MAGERINLAQAENLLAILAHDDKNGRLVAAMANPDLFEGDYRVIAERLIGYWKKQKKAPKVHAADLFADILDDKNNRKAKTFERILRFMEQLAKEANTVYVLDTLRSFTRLQTMKDAILKAAEKLSAGEENTIQEVEAMLGDLLRARTHNFDPGITLANIGQVLDWLELAQSEFKTGIAVLDARYVVPSRGATFLWLAPPNVGKTWALINTGKHALLQRKKVLHISLEMSAEETAQRYYQALFSISKRRERIDVRTMEVDDEFYLRRMAKIVHVEPDFAFGDAHGVARRLRRELEPWKLRIPNLMIKRFPPRALTMAGLRAYLDALEDVTGFIPDELILDYIGITNTDAKNHRISLGRNFEEFRAVCVERNIAGVTAGQVSKIGAESNLVRATHTAEDYSMIATTDVAVTISQTAAEERMALARLFVDKARSERGKFGCVVTQAFGIGQFALQSAYLDRTYHDFVREETTDDDKEADRGRESEYEGE